MPNPKSPLPLLLLALALAGFAAYLAFGPVAAAGSEFSHPDAAASPLATEREPDMSPAPGSTSGAELVLHLRPRARLARSLRAEPEVRVLRAGALVPMQVEPVARAAGRHLLRLTNPAGESVYRIVSALPEAGEALVVELGSEVPCRGIVEDAAGTPLAGAQVWLDGQQTETDAAGEWRFARVVGGAGVPLVVRASGHAEVQRVLELRPVAGEPLRVRLDAGVSLRVRLAAPVVDGPPPAVYVLPGGGDPDTRWLHFPFWRQGLSGGHRIGADGSVRIEHLPAGASVRALIAHPWLESRVSAPVRLHDQETTLVVQAGALAELRGKVVDAQGRPLAGVCVTAQPAGEEAPTVDPRWLLPDAAQHSGRVTCRSDADGSYRIGRPADSRAGTSVRASAPGRYAHEVLVARAADALVHDLVLPELATGEPELRFVRPDAAQLLHVRIVERGRTTRHLLVPAGQEAFVVPLREACVLEVHAGASTWPALAVAGTVELKVPR